jgi:hypothetical protein
MRRDPVRELWGELRVEPELQATSVG